MLRTAAALLGIIYIMIGIIGFIPGVAPNEYLLKIFHVNTHHNILRILSGAIALWVARSSALASRVFFQIFGILFVIFGIWGFIYDTLHPPANWFHLILGIFALFFGFRPKRKKK